MATKIIKNDIEYSVNDTLKLLVNVNGIEEGATLRFIIAAGEETGYSIDNVYHPNSNGSTFTVTLSEKDKKKIPIGDYHYKIILLKADGTVITQKSGYFRVKWGA